MEKEIDWMRLKADKSAKKMLVNLKIWQWKLPKLKQKILGTSEWSSSALNCETLKPPDVPVGGGPRAGETLEEKNAEKFPNLM